MELVDIFLNYGSSLQGGLCLSISCEGLYKEGGEYRFRTQNTQVALRHGGGLKSF